jgi:hypothetical protein
LPTVIIQRGLSNEDACRIEMAFIAAIGRGRSGPLVNMTDGGEGLSGRSMPDEIKAKIGNAHRGRKLSEEHRAKISASRKTMFEAERAAGIRRTISDDHKAAIGRAGKGKIIADWHRDAVSKAQRGKTIAPEHREKLCLSVTGHKQTPEQIAKRVAATRATKGLGNSEGFG